jgi:hypothetical protein
MIAQIEHPRESDGGIARLVPQALFVLRAGQEVYAAAIRPSTAQAVCDAVETTFGLFGSPG